MAKSKATTEAVATEESTVEETSSCDCIKAALITGSSDPQPGSESEWPADATAVRVAGDVVNNVGVIAPSSGVAQGQQVTLACPLGAKIYGVGTQGNRLSIPAGSAVSLMYIDGVWYQVGG